MSIHTNANYEDAEDDGAIELVLAAVTYVGDRSTYNNDAIRQQGGYPALDGFQQGITKLVRLPSKNLGWWERNGSFEIDYSDSGIAEVLLTSNYIPEQLAGPGYDPKLRDSVLEQLDMEPATDAEGYREQLREIADIDPEEETSTTESGSEQTRVDYLTSEVERSTLMSVAGTYDDLDEYLEEVEKDQVSHLAQTELAEFLAEKEDSAVDERIDRTRVGEE